MKLIKFIPPTGLFLAALAIAAMTQAKAQEYTFTTLAGPPEPALAPLTARAMRRGSTTHGAWRWTARATCMWRTGGTPRFGR